MVLASDHPVWSVLTEDLVFELLDQIPRMTSFLTKALVRLSLVLLQHPKVAVSCWGAFYLDKSGAFWSVAGSIPVSDPFSVSGSSAPVLDFSPSAGSIQETQDVQVPTAPSDAPPEGLVASSGGVCCRNGRKVGLRGSGVSNSGIQAGGNSVGGEKRKVREGAVGEGDTGDGSDRPKKRGGGLEGRGKSSGRGSGAGKGGNASARKKVSGVGVEGFSSTSESTVTWLSDGRPPKLDNGAKDLFARLASLHTDSGMASLTTLLHELMSGTPSDLNLTVYDLSFASILAQCAELSSTRAAREFRAAILYIRLAIHFD